MKSSETTRSDMCPERARVQQIDRFFHYFFYYKKRDISPKKRESETRVKTRYFPPEGGNVDQTKDNQLD